MATKKNTDTDRPSVRMKLFKNESDSSSIVSALLNPSDKGKKSIEIPPLSPKKLAAIFELSSSLRPPVDAYITNIESRGYHFKPAIDLDSPDATEKVAEAMFVDELVLAYESEDKKELSDKLMGVEEPSEDDVEEKVKYLKRLAALELAIAKRFFSSCYPDGSFIDLRKITRQDMEVTGNGYWEILRGKNGKPRNIVFVPSSTMRLGKMSDTEKRDITVKSRRRVTAITWEEIKVKRTFKKFVQVDEGENPVAWFKEFGDPRIMSQKSGKYYFSLTELVRAEGKETKQATEVFHFSITSLASEYGMPRWSGNIPAVLGSRELDETNLDYFLSNAVPALALLCAGGRFGKKVEERLKEFFAEEVRGRRATNKLVVLEAESQRRSTAGGPSATPKIDFVPLRNAQIQDALFQNYDERNTQKISRSYRLPTSLLGGSRFQVGDLRFAEEQVYQPERESFDSCINKFFMPELGITFWEFESNPTMARDPEVIGTLALTAADKGVIIPTEARKILEQVFSREFPAISELWAKQPLPMTLAALGVLSGPAAAVREQGRQAGNAPPLEQLLAEAGAAPKGEREEDDEDENSLMAGTLTDEQINQALAALDVLKPLGFKLSRQGQGNDE